MHFVPIEALDPPAPLVRLRVRVPACAGPGGDLKYCILVENCSPAEAHHVIVKDPLPKNATFVKADPEPTLKDGELRWHIGTLGGGACREIILFLRPTDLEDIKNCIRVQYEHGQCVTTRQLAGFGPGAGPGTVPGKIDSKEKEKDKDKDKKDKIPVPPDKDKLPKLKLTLDGPAKEYKNRAARYFLTVANEGKGPATNVGVTFDPDKNAEFVKASEKGIFMGGRVAWALGTLEVGESRTVVVELKAKAMGKLCHQAEAKADFDIRDRGEICTVFEGISALLLEMFDREDPIEMGAETSYPILVRNTGDAPVTNLRITALVGEGLALTRAKGPIDHRMGAKGPRGQELLFDPLPSLAPGAELNLEVFVKGTRPGDNRFSIEMTADQLKEGGPVGEVESTQVFVEDGRLMSRRLSRPTAYRPPTDPKK